MKRIFTTLPVLLLLLFIVGLVGVLIAPRFGWQLDILYGGSMEPSMKVGCLAVVQPVEPHDISAGDIIAYVPPVDDSVRTTHRVIEVVQDENSLVFRTKGDANEQPDTYAVPAENVQGKVRFRVPYAGYFIDFTKTPHGFGLIVGMPAVLIVGSEARNIFLTARNLRRKGRVKQGSHSIDVYNDADEPEHVFRFMDVYSCSIDFYNSADEPQALALNVELGVSIVKGHEYVAHLDYNPVIGDIPALETRELYLEIYLNEDWAEADDDKEIKLIVDVTREDNSPRHHVGMKLAELEICRGDLNTQPDMVGRNSSGYHAGRSDAAGAEA